MEPAGALRPAHQAVKETAGRARAKPKRSKTIATFAFASFPIVLILFIRVFKDEAFVFGQFHHAIERVAQISGS